jgi:hypothetical protein
MTEERKFAILFAATILAARRLIDLDADKPNMAKEFFLDRAIDEAVFILERIDARWPTIVNSFSARNLSLEKLRRWPIADILLRLKTLLPLTKSCWPFSLWPVWFSTRSSFLR